MEPLTCIVIVEMQRCGVCRVWRDLPDSRDWDRLIAFKERDGWVLKSHRREFVRLEREELEDQVEFAA